LLQKDKIEQGRIQGGAKGAIAPPPLAKKRKEEREEGRQKERKIVNLNSFDILNIARRASEGIWHLMVVYLLTT